MWVSGPLRPLPPTQSFGPSVYQELFHRSRPQRIRAFVVPGLGPPFRPARDFGPSTRVWPSVPAAGNFGPSFLTDSWALLEGLGFQVGYSAWLGTGCPNQGIVDWEAIEY